MKLYLGADHGGFELKEIIKEYLLAKNQHEIEDLGAYSTDSVDYPTFGHKVGNAVVKDSDSLGIIVCGTGIGISVAANKVKGIRAALCHSVEYAKLAREHNNANVLSLGGRFIEVEDAKNIVDAFLSTDFEGGRHQRRVDAIEI